jgi:hypothetical protein
MAKQFDNMRCGVEKMKSILICDFFYWVILDTTRPLFKTIDNNKYVFVAIDHYSKWCETRLIENVE